MKMDELKHSLEEKQRMIDLGLTVEGTLTSQASTDEYMKMDELIKSDN